MLHSLTLMYYGCNNYHGLHANAPILFTSTHLHSTNLCTNLSECSERPGKTRVIMHVLGASDTMLVWLAGNGTALAWKTPCFSNFKNCCCCVLRLATFWYLDNLLTIFCWLLVDNLLIFWWHFVAGFGMPLWCNSCHSEFGESDRLTKTPCDAFHSSAGGCAFHLLDRFSVMAAKLKAPLAVQYNS